MIKDTITSILPRHRYFIFDINQSPIATEGYRISCNSIAALSFSYRHITGKFRIPCLNLGFQSVIHTPPSDADFIRTISQGPHNAAPRCVSILSRCEDTSRTSRFSIKSFPNFSFEFAKDAKLENFYRGGENASRLTTRVSVIYKNNLETALIFTLALGALLDRHDESSFGGLKYLEH